MTSITNAKLDWNDAGTPVSDQFDDVYFSNVNGLEETRYVFLSQNHLPQRWQDYDKRRFTIGETGFGTGLNFLAAWQWFDKFRQENPTSAVKELHFISFEKFPLNLDDLVQAHNAWPELAEYAEKLQKHYPIAVPECHRIVLDDGAVTLDLWFGDIKDCMPIVPTQQDGLIDAWFLDGFAPSKNPEMWNQELFDNMAKLSKPDGTCATFTAAGFVRRGLIEAGFDMKKVKGFGTKREMIAGARNNKTPYSNIQPYYTRQAALIEADDIAIIGGGIASATLAKTLARRGVKVTLYCSDEKAAQGASGNRQGAVYPLLNGEHSGVSKVFAPGMLFARQFVEQCFDEFTFDHNWCGVTQLMWNEDAKRKLTRILNGNFPVDLIKAHTEAETESVTGLPCGSASVSYPLGGWLCPAELTQGIIDNLVKNQQLNVVYSTPIEKIQFDEYKQMWQLTNGDNQFAHRSVVIANGHQFDKFVQTQDLPLGKVKGQVSHIPTTENLSQLKTVLCYDAT